MALAAAKVMQAKGRTETKIGGVDAMPPAIKAVQAGQMYATVRNPSCRIHGGAIIAGVSAVINGAKTGTDIPEHHHGRAGRHQGERRRDALDGGSVPHLIEVRENPASMRSALLNSPAYPSRSAACRLCAPSILRSTPARFTVSSARTARARAADADRSRHPRRL